MNISGNKAWEITVVAGLSLVNFLEQQLDDKELAVVIEGWTQWATANIPPGNEDLADKAITVMFNRYTESCIKEGGTRLAAQERVIEVFKEKIGGSK